MEFIIILIIVVLLIVIIKGSSSKLPHENNYSNQLQENISKISDFSATHLHITPGAHQAIALDVIRQSLGIFKIQKNIFYKRLYHFTDIIEVSILEDDAVESTTATSRSSQVVGAAVGGLLLGGTGVILGGLSGKKKAISQEFVTSLSLRIVIDDLCSPVCKVSFFAGRISKKTAEYQTIKNNLSQWNGLLTVLLRRCEQLSPDQFIKEKELAKQISKDNLIAPESSPLEDELITLVRAGKKIAAIKRYRETNNVGLREAKDYIDSL